MGIKKSDEIQNMMKGLDETKLRIKWPDGDGDDTLTKSKLSEAMTILGESKSSLDWSIKNTGVFDRGITIAKEDSVFNASRRIAELSSELESGKARIDQLANDLDQLRLEFDKRVQVEVLAIIPMIAKEISRHNKSLAEAEIFDVESELRDMDETPLYG